MIGAWSDRYPSFQRSNNAGISFRAVRSPEAPKMMTLAVSGRGRISEALVESVEVDSDITVDLSLPKAVR